MRSSKLMNTAPCVVDIQPNNFNAHTIGSRIENDALGFAEADIKCCDLAYAHLRW